MLRAQRLASSVCSGSGDSLPCASRCPLLRGRTSSGSESHCTLPVHGLRRSGGHSLSARSGPYGRKHWRGGGGRILSIGDRLHGGHLRGRRGHRSRSPLHSTVAPFEFFYKEQVYYLRNYISQLAPPYRWFKKAKSTKHVSWGLLDGGIRGDSHVVLHAFLRLNMFPKQACGSGGFQPQGTERPSSKCIMQ